MNDSYLEVETSSSRRRNEMDQHSDGTSRSTIEHVSGKTVIFLRENARENAYFHSMSKGVEN
mgnify:CR=1 FL=1